ncbi:hypothetical protein GQ44DRAFT_763039 [Phaeosphaeriaceae sp. PMI808]|nr:hypothetical protein GQ44DRAFT_763039 [Phaeosphaeriaceae sp. PMI808]
MPPTMRRLDVAAYTVGWICALPVEFAAAQIMLDEEHLPPEGIDPNQYTLGCIGVHNVVLVSLPAGKIGIGAAAFGAGQAMSTFRSIRFGLMVGVGGGVPSTEADVRLGDVVISHPANQHGGVVQYDFGKTGEGGHMTRTGFLNAPPKELLSSITQLRVQDFQDRSSLATHLSTFNQFPRFMRENAGLDVLFEPNYKHGSGLTCKLCDQDRVIQRPEREADKMVTLHYGTIASGNQVIKDGTTRDERSEELGGVLCFEMEAAGLMNDFPCLVVRGICDYADSHKNKTWQPHAAATAAACAKSILSLVPSAPVVETNIAKETSKYRVPFDLKRVPVGKFADRLRDTQAMERVLLPSMGSTGRNILFLHGLGGAGKTQLAVDFARRHQHTFSSILWLDGSGKSNLKQSLATFASCIPEGQIATASRGYVAGEASNLDMIVRDVLGWLGLPENTGWLMVMDNVDRDYLQREEDKEAYDIEEYFPEADHGSILVTTRLRQLTQFGEQWEVKKVDNKQAKAIFETWYGETVGSESDELLNLLDGLPLALTQAAAYMNNTGINFDTYTRLYKEQWQELMDSADEKHMTLRTYANGSVATTWTISYAAIKKKNQSAANLLLLWAHLDNKSMWHGLLADGSKNSRTCSTFAIEWLGKIAQEEVEFINAIGLLRSYSLVEKMDDGTGFSTHPVVHQWARQIQTQSQRKELIMLAIIVVGWAVPDKGEQNYWQDSVRLLPHAEQCEKAVEATLRSQAESNEIGARVKRKAVSAAVYGLGILFQHLRKLSKAEQMYIYTLAEYKKTLGVGHLETFRVTIDLGRLYTRQGKLDDAEKTLSEMVEKLGMGYGVDHKTTQKAVNNLGNVYFKQRKYKDAERLYKQRLQVLQRESSADSMSWGIGIPGALSNLGLVQEAQGRDDEAESKYIEALEGYEKELGKDHVMTLEAANRLANLYQKTGKKDIAEERYLQVLEVCDKMYGKDSKLICKPAMQAMWDLGHLLKVQNRNEDAIKWYAKALSGYEQMYGKNHAECTKLRNNLIRLEKKEGGSGVQLDQDRRMQQQSNSSSAVRISEEAGVKGQTKQVGAEMKLRGNAFVPVEQPKERVFEQLKNFGQPLAPKGNRILRRLGWKRS